MNIARNISKIVVCILAMSGTKLIVRAALAFVLPQSTYAKIALWVASGVITASAAKAVSGAAQEQIDELYDEIDKVHEIISSR